MRNMRIRIQTHIRQRHPTLDQKPTRALLQPRLDDVERVLALPSLRRNLRSALLTQVLNPDDLERGPQDRDARLVLVLLKEHPAQHFSAVESVGGDERG